MPAPLSNPSSGETCVSDRLVVIAAGREEGWRRLASFSFFTGIALALSRSEIRPHCLRRLRIVHKRFPVRTLFALAKTAEPNPRL